MVAALVEMLAVPVVLVVAQTHQQLEEPLLLVKGITVREVLTHLVQVGLVQPGLIAPEMAGKV
jgi:hypothetical protein